VREENNTLRVMFEVLSSKYTKLESHLQEINKEQHKGMNQIGSVTEPILDVNKRRRLEFPTAKKPLQIFVRTHPMDDSLVCAMAHHYKFGLCICELTLIHVQIKFYIEVSMLMQILLWEYRL